MPDKPYKPTLLLDFDGVCHRYDSPWQGATVIPDEYVPGLFEFLEAAKPHFDIQVFSSRSHEPGGIQAMRVWFVDQWNLWRMRKQLIVYEEMPVLSFPTIKPPAFMTIDDRGFCFEGTWPDVQTLLNFKPWNKRG